MTKWWRELTWYMQSWHFKKNLFRDNQRTHPTQQARLLVLAPGPTSPAHERTCGSYNLMWDEKVAFSTRLDQMISSLRCDQLWSYMFHYLPTICVEYTLVKRLRKIVNHSIDHHSFIDSRSQLENTTPVICVHEGYKWREYKTKSSKTSFSKLKDVGKYIITSSPICPNNSKHA